jgi:TonB-linked SusC/RagA family outer membrane protein
VGAVLLGVLWSTTALAQQRLLHGTVSDFTTGAPVVAATVSVKGTNIGAVTTGEGRFTIAVPPGALTMNVRRVGYQLGTVPVAPDQSDVDVKLRATVIELGELVVTGQATSVTRRNLANDVATVAGEDVNRVHTETIENGLQGKVAGVIITENSGAPGGGLQVRMRGVTSIFGNSQPLYVVDGVPVSNTVIQNGLNSVSQAAAPVLLGASNQDNGVNRIADLNPADIESYDILKGPSAAAIYGSSAANGVIIIRTRRGTPGDPRFSVTQRLGTHMLQHKIGQRQFSLADGIVYSAPVFCSPPPGSPPGTPAPQCSADSAAVKQMFQASGGFQDYEQQIFGDKSLSYETDVSVNGGAEKTQYYVSALEQHDNGIMYSTGYDKQGLRTNITQLIGSKLQIQANASFVHTLTKRGFSNNDNVNVTPYFVIAGTPSFFNYQPVNGVYPVQPFFAPGTNPLQTLSQFSLPEDVFRFTGSVEASYSLLNTGEHSLKATLNAGIDNYSYKASIYAPATLIWQAVSGLPGLSGVLNGTESQPTAALSVTHTYTPTSNAFTATTSVGLRSGFRSIATTNVVTQNLLANQQNVDLGTAVSVFANRQKVRTLSLFGQEEVLLLDERLLVSGGVLVQKSTNNADVDKLWGYPKVAASYRFPTLGPFEELKFRAAFGETGNEPLYGQKFTALTGLTYVGNNAVQIQGSLADPSLHPEREREIEGGVDLTLLQSRVGLSATVYQKNNTDLILQAALAPSTGYAVHIFNGGEIRNRGVEASLSGFPLRTKDVSWLARVTFTRNTGVVMSLPVPAFQPPNFFSIHYGSGYIQAGQSPSQIIGYQTDTIAYPKGRTRGRLGDYEPKFTMGFSSQVSSGPLSVYGLVEWRRGGSVVNLTQNGYDSFGTAADCTAGNASDGCTGSSPSAQRLYLFNIGRSPYIQDASFVKIREITLSYQLPQHIVRSVFGERVSAVRADLSGRNLVTWTPYLGADPEVSNFGNQNINRGQDVTPYPPNRSYFFTLSVDF